MLRDAALRASLAGALLVAPLPAQPGDAGAGEMRVEDVRSLPRPAELQAGTIAFSDSQTSDIADPGTGMIRFERWAEAMPLARRLLSLYPSYVEPSVSKTAQGETRSYVEKLHVYRASARFLVGRPPAAVDLARFMKLSFLERIDPAIEHTAITASETRPSKDPKFAHNLDPARSWCTGAEQICIRSRYRLEGKLPAGVKLANQIRESARKIPDYLEFESELRLLSPGELGDGALRELTGIDTPVAAAVQQSVFYVNQVMQFGKLLALVQAHPADSGKSVVTALVALGVESDVLELKKEYAQYPVLRNLVPVQVLLGKSSFNVGTSLSAGLPSYARNRIKAIAELLQGG